MAKAKKPWSKLAVIGLAVLVALCIGGLSLSKSAEAKKKPHPSAKAQKAAYAIFNKKCLSCHVSVADPERKGKTRDDWMLVVRYMDTHFVNLTDAEASKIVDLLFALRNSPDKEPG